MIARAFLRALAQLGDRRFRRVFWLGIGITLAALFAAQVAVLWLVRWLVGSDASLPLIGPLPWLGDALGWSSLALMIVLSVFLMVPVASAVISFLLDDIAQAVEDRHYPALPPAPGVPITEEIRDALGFFGVLVAANLLALVVAGALFLVFPPAWAAVFWGVNGYLLGREYFTLVAMRRIGRAEARRLRAEHAALIWLAGLLMAIPLTIPVINLVVPILGAAVFTHIFHGLQGTRPGPGPDQ
ncbi:EI24 domain-containing protein [Pontibaca methylaminivorans]|uniref:Uncharacterized protein involved in cysteine biosynthesis n=1 Tax=Pontibaca methylaminivorans TaxID=515897 RepID=A0A1R3WPT7_9RHOB|nr:EI24 domain-containing protein [Pontibaca methylaminivorans]SIT80167.1 Uncharacterized protein involved in cysteine biosynthesis [Pontibaca methylaminivorans]